MPGSGTSTPEVVPDEPLADDDEDEELDEDDELDGEELDEEELELDDELELEEVLEACSPAPQAVKARTIIPKNAP